MSTCQDVAASLYVDTDAAKLDLSKLSSKSPIEVIVVSKDEEKLVVQTTTPEGEKVETEVKKPVLVKMMLLMTISNALLGTKNLEQLGIGLLKAGIAPILEKWGIDPSFFLDSMNYQQYDVFDQMLDTMTDEQCEELFSKSVDNKSLPALLQQVHPDHLKKIFNPAGTEKFDSRTLFTSNEHQLPQELVDRMYAALTPRQRADLHIPEAKTQPAS